MGIIRLTKTTFEGLFQHNPHFLSQSSKTTAEMPLLILLLVLPLSLAQTTSPPSFTIPCVMTSPSCPSSMTCTPTSVCSDGLSSCTGVCYTTPPPLPSSGCYVSNSITTCSQATETCAPFYSTCTTANCLGTCISTSTPVTTPCVVSGSPTCSTPLTCTPTESSTPGQPWGGVCITPAPPGPTSACLVSNPVTTCSHTTETCSPFSSTCTTANCLGTCVAGPTASPTPRECYRREDCGWGWKCVKKCAWCEGVCLRV